MYSLGCQLHYIKKCCENYWNSALGVNSLLKWRVPYSPLMDFVMTEVMVRYERIWEKIITGGWMLDLPSLFIGVPFLWFLPTENVESTSLHDFNSMNFYLSTRSQKNWWVNPLKLWAQKMTPPLSCACLMFQSQQVMQ